jgi:hypothetical protein
VIDAEMSDAYDSAGAMLDAYGVADDDARRAMIRSLLPSVDELREYFLDGAIDDVLAAYRVHWDDDPVWAVEEGVEAIVYCARGREFRRGSMMTRQFPGGYRAVGQFLQPRAIWVAWEFVAPEHPAVSFDGLVRVAGGAWRWCPRPWRILSTRASREAWEEAEARKPVIIDPATEAAQTLERSRRRDTVAIRIPARSG